MNSLNIYSQYNNQLYSVDTLVNRFEKYKNCFSVNIFDKELDKIISNMRLGYKKLLVLTQCDLSFDIGATDHQKMQVIVQLSDLIKNKWHNMISELKQLDEFKRNSLLDHMANCNRMMLRLVSKMEQMLMQSQYINQSLRVSA